MAARRTDIRIRIVLRPACQKGARSQDLRQEKESFSHTLAIVETEALKENGYYITIIEFEIIRIILT